MAKRRNKPRERQDEDTSIRFEGLDGRPDDEFVDPLDSEPGEREEEDPRADDPFADTSDDDEAPEQRASEGEERGDDSEDEAEEERPADDDGSAEDVTDPALQTQLDQLRHELDTVRRDRDLSRLQAAQANKSLYETRANEVDGQLERTQVDLEKAIEEGETRKQVELHNRLAELHATKRELASLKERADREEQERPREEQRQPSSEAPPQQITAQTQAAEQWMRGRQWINNPAYAQQNRELIRIASVLVEDGYDPNRRDYYDELERRMRRKHPDLFSNGQARRPERRPDRQTVGRVSRDDPPRPGNSKQVVLTREDRENMRRFSLDPGNKDHVREYARSKRESERAGTR